MKKTLFLIGLVLVFLLGCSVSEQNAEFVKFTSNEHGFSFNYPSKWIEFENDLPDKWAIKDANDNTILFVINPMQEKDLMIIGVSQAISDVYPDARPEDIDENEIANVQSMVKLQEFNGKTWFTYGVNFDKLNAKSLISGTLCKENEVLFVLVTDPLSEEYTQANYNALLNSFTCE